MSATKLICVTYTDELSAGNLSLNDLLISFRHKIFAANTARLRSFQNGDYVILCATQHKEKFFFVAKILAPSEHSFSDWKDQGGQEWKYNFHIEPITDIITLTPKRKTQIHDILESQGLNSKNLLHPRFCSEKLLTGLNTLLRIGILPTID